MTVLWVSLESSPSAFYVAPNSSVSDDRLFALSVVVHGLVVQNAMSTHDFALDARNLENARTEIGSIVYKARAETCSGGIGTDRIRSSLEIVFRANHDTVFLGMTSNGLRCPFVRTPVCTRSTQFPAAGERFGD